ncbi:MAG: ABC transporter substrate-binding protein [Tenericutes bacterium]|nr:ABC transporter substrate-binding protein [Mycoplasmatota bacterium]
MKKISRKIFIISIIIITSIVLIQCKSEENKTLTVGAAEISGNFISGFGNNKYDGWVKDLIYGYETYTITEHGEIILNQTVVENVTTSLASNDDKTYTFIIHDDLKWSDGKQITASDYVFSLLLQASKEWITAGALSTLGESLVGYEEYRVDVTSANTRFHGVKLINEFSFSLTIKGELLPYFYETLYVAVSPLPLHVLAPEEAIIDSNNQGTRISVEGFDLVPSISKIGGYRYIPTVTCGPYRFISFIDQVVTLEKNDYFKGNVYGDTPSIKNIIIKKVNQTLDVDLVIEGEIDLVVDVIEGSKIENAEASLTTNTNYYSRNGYGILVMQAHFGPTQDYKVRQAIAHLANRESFLNHILDGYGSLTYSEYSLAQWMYIRSEAWIDENINQYAYSLDDAKNILDETDWIYESDGTTTFDTEKAVVDSEYYRHNENGEVLKINHLSTPSGSVNNFILFDDSIQKAGILYEYFEKSFDTLIDHYFYAYELEESEKLYHVFSLATNFTVVYDPYYSWHTDFLGTWRNGHQLEDSPENPAAPLNEENGLMTLDELTVAMRQLDPNDKETYLELWREYQIRWNTLIPNLPLYSNQYYDIFNSKLQGVESTPYWNWALMINNITFS